MRTEVPGFFVRDDDPDFVELYRASYAELLQFICKGLDGGTDLAQLELPAAVVAEMRATAALGIELNAVLRVCRIAQRLMLEQAIETAHATIADAALRTTVLRAVSRWLFDYFDWLALRESEVYEHERDLLVRDRALRRRQVVRDVLDGRALASGALDYELERDHLAVIAWGEEPERALCRLRGATGLDLVEVAGTGSTAWAWLGAGRIGEREVGAASRFVPPMGTHLAIGEPAHGVDGFRLTHRQAWNVYRIIRHAPQPVTLHADVALLTLTLQDPALAREFVHRELGPLAEHDERNAILIETLRAYFAAGQNAASAAAALGVHNRTVLYRLRSIEDRLGYPLGARRDELAVAVRLHPVLPAA